MEETQQKLNQLKKYFEKREDVVMAFVFGSQSKKIASGISDWDLAVYFKPEIEKVEWEEQNREYPKEDEVWGDCIEILETDNVDLIVLNRAPASIADSAIRGIPLTVKDRGLWLDFMLLITRQAEDFREFVDDYFAMSQRSSSLNARDVERLKRTIKFLQEQFSLYESFKEFSFSDYEDIHKRNDVERWIENIVNAGIDIAKTILVSRKKSIPGSYHETMAIGVVILKLPEDFSRKFEKWVRLRNVLAHEYLDIKWKRVENFIKESEPYFRQLTESAKEFIK